MNIGSALSEKTGKLKERHVFLLILLAGLLVATLSGSLFYNETPKGDNSYYYKAANVVKDEPLGWVDSEDIGVVESLNAIVQGYGMLLPGNDFQNVYLIQIIVFALTGLMIYKTARCLLGRMPSLAAVLLFLLNNRHWQHIYYFKPGIWVNLFLISCVYAMFRIVAQPRETKAWVLLGLCSGLLLLTDLRYLPHLALAYLVLLFIRDSFRAKAGRLALAILLAALVITPWVARQSLLHDKFILISDLQGLTFDRALNTPRWQDFQNKRDRWMVLATIPEEEFSLRYRELADSLELTPGELMSARRSASRKGEWGAANTNQEMVASGAPRDAELARAREKYNQWPKLARMLRSAAIFWEPFRFHSSFELNSGGGFFYEPASLTSNLNRFFFLGLLLPFLVIGLVALGKTNAVAAAIATAILVVHTFVHAYVALAIWRYMLPLLPLVSIVAIFGAKNLYKHVKKKIDGSLRAPDHQISLGKDAKDAKINARAGS